MTTTEADEARALYEQCRELGWSRERACRVSGVAVRTAEEWDAPIEQILRQRDERARQGVDLRQARQRPRRKRERLVCLGTVSEIPLGVREDDT
jgi:hypothetical protein